VKLQKLEQLLSEHGCFKVRDKGKHAIWKSPGGAIASVPRHAEVKKHTARGICKDLGIDPQKVTS
jgi:predicted RNA binding protein YcfA (HicA-like mRNA interferase family)